jgi:small-conductance mechanosensitive channel/CRP-like cAMP-binding protein
MIDQRFPEAAGAVVIVYLALVLLAHQLRRVRAVRFTWAYHLFALAAGLLTGAHFLPESLAWRPVALQHLTAAVVVLAAFPLVTLLNRAFWIRFDAEGKRLEAPRVLLDLTGVVVALVAVVATMQFIYGLQVPGLLAGSGVAALVLGLGMQDQLKNMFAGLSLHFEKPFKTGDWLLIDGVHAKVIEISWRSTRLVTTEEVQIEMDNSRLLNQTIYNFELPTPDHALRATIGLHYDVPPAQAMEVLRTAAASVPGVMAEREPVVYLKDFADSAVVYEIKFWIRDHALMSRVLSDVRAHCWYAVRRAGMEIPYPQRVIHQAVAADTGVAARQAAAGMLRAHKIFGCLTVEQCAALVQASPVVKFANHEHLLEQGAPGSSMFVLVRGGVDVRLAHDGQTKSVAKLGAGDCLGEMSLLTGDPRTATVVAEGEVEAVEIGLAVFGAFVRSNPAVVEQLSELLTQRQLANIQHTAQGPAATPEQVRSGMLRKLRAFFALGD